MRKKRISLGDQIRQAVRDAPTSRNALCKAAGIDPGSFSRFMSGTVGLSLETLNALAAVLSLRVVTDGQAKLPAPGKPGRPPGRRGKGTSK